jgi:hypothetical protein
MRQLVCEQSGVEALAGVDRLHTIRLKPRLQLREVLA